MNESEGTDTSLLYSYPRRGPKRSISGLFVMQPLLPRGRGEGKNKKTYSCPRNSSGFYSIGFFDKSELYGNVYDWQRVGMGWDRVVWGMGMEGGGFPCNVSLLFFEGFADRGLCLSPVVLLLASFNQDAYYTMPVITRS